MGKQERHLQWFARICIVFNSLTFILCGFDIGTFLREDKIELAWFFVFLAIVNLYCAKLNVTIIRRSKAREQSYGRSDT